MSNLELPSLKINNKVTISRQIYTFLRHIITTASISPGTSISENELSKHFNVSRQPVREALTTLEHDGLITIIPQKGTVVKRISVANLKSVVFIREALECASLDNISNLPPAKLSKALRKLHNNLDDQRRKVDPCNLASSFLPIDDKFHEIICSFSDCSMTWEAIQSIKGQLDRIRYLAMGSDHPISPIEKLMAEHEEVVKAIDKGDIEEAKRLLRYHLHEIMQTHVSIRQQYSEWFEPEN